MPGVFANRTQAPNPKTCFVMMPFSDAFMAIYRLIQRCCNEQGLDCRRADEDALPGQITSKIYESVSDAGIIIADMTGRNANVFYELGLAHAVSDKVILLTQSTTDVPFDLRDFIHIEYENTFQGAEKLASELSKALTAILRSADTSQRNPKDRTGTSANGLPVASQVLDVTDDMTLLHLNAEISRNAGDMAAAFNWLNRAVEIADAGHGDANDTGNCAIEAERCGFLELAERLYKLAVQREPQHVNNRQCYASFILDHRAGDPEKMRVASEILDELEKTPQRQERTRALRAQYLSKSPLVGDGTVDREELLKDLVGDGEFESLEQAAPILQVLMETGYVEQFRKIIASLRERVGTGQQVALDRVLADALANTEDMTLRAEAVSLYELILERGCADPAAVKHNLATLVFSANKSDPGGRAHQLWKESYSANRREMRVRKAFAQYLVRQGKAEVAQKVLAGEPID